jgi:hypothetical protein
LAQLYERSHEYAAARGEAALWEESTAQNRVCADAIDTAVKKHADARDALADVEARHGAERVAWVLASYLKSNPSDGRFSRENRAWADAVSIPLRGGFPEVAYVLRERAAVLNAFMDAARGDFVPKQDAPPESEKFYALYRDADATTRILLEFPSRDARDDAAGRLSSARPIRAREAAARVQAGIETRAAEDFVFPPPNLEPPETEPSGDRVFQSPPYTETEEYARLHGETYAFNESRDLNSACAAAILSAIHRVSATGGEYRLHDAVRDVSELYGEARLRLVLAMEIQSDDSGARWGDGNLAWAASLAMPPETVASRGYDIETAHIVHLNGFTHILRLAEQEQEALPQSAPPPTAAPKPAREERGAVPAEADPPPAPRADEAGAPEEITPEAFGARAAVNRVLRARAQTADDPPELTPQASGNASARAFLSNNNEEVIN